MHHYQLHDLVVISDLEFHLPEVDSLLVPDLTLRQSADPMDVDWEPKPDDLLIDLREEDRGPVYVAAKTPGGYRFRSKDLCDFDLSADLTDGTWAMAPGSDRGIISVVAVGALMAFRLIIDGHLVLHASAVRARGRVLVFVGSSGMGKSTMAAMMCAGGAALLTDDVARINFEDRQALLSPGGTESRLRPAAAQLADLFDVTRATSDGRTAVSLPCWTAGPVAIDAVVVPIPSRENEDVELTALSPADALVVLSQFPRLPGWVDSQVLQCQFNLLADMLERVPAYLAIVPWGPPFVAETGGRLLDALGWDNELG